MRYNDLLGVLSTIFEQQRGIHHIGFQISLPFQINVLEVLVLRKSRRTSGEAYPYFCQHDTSFHRCNCFVILTAFVDVCGRRKQLMAVPGFGRLGVRGYRCFYYFGSCHLVCRLAKAAAVTHFNSLCSLPQSNAAATVTSCGLPPVLMVHDLNNWSDSDFEIVDMCYKYSYTSPHLVWS